MIPELRDRLEDTIDRMWDLETPFAKRCYWYPNFQGSSSIKTALPTFAPGFSYTNLEIQRGDQAQLEYAKMIGLPKGSDKFSEIQNNLLKYCAQDALAMAVVLHYLVRIISYHELRIAV